MATHYTPKWKDKNGNVMIFPAGNTLFDEHGDATDWQMGQFLFMVPFGLSADGILEFDADDGKFEIPHVVATLRPLTDYACVIEGPMLEDVRAEASTTES